MGILFYFLRILSVSPQRFPGNERTDRSLLVRTIDNQWEELSITSVLARTKLTKPSRRRDVFDIPPGAKLNSSLSQIMIMGRESLFAGDVFLSRVHSETGAQCALIVG